MIGTTRSRVSHFMNRFRQHGFIENNSRIRYTSHCSMSFCTINPLGKKSVSAAVVETGPAQSEKAQRRAASVGVKVRHHDGLKD